MGCVTSKDAEPPTPARFDPAGGFKAESISGRRDRVESSSSARSTADSGRIAESVASWAADSGGRDSSTNTTTCGSESVSFRLGNLQKYVESEQAAAGWPTWLSAVAGEAIQGWIPLRPDSFEKLEKIGQGTYSSVFRARDHDSGKIVALKKVRFDSLEPESVRFMAREIMILRRLDHPNIIKLQGIISSRLSSTIYLVFEYMEHDLSGLSSSPDISFTEPQVKCYMKQLLSGLEHCHSRGVMHRDIKGSNLLINNEGILKVADFGLANFFNLSNKQPMTSRVVTLWYRPPELLLGATNYGPSVDLWSVGCVFSELLLGKPLLQGRTEVEQLHKIFKLCGSPPDEYWKKSRLPHATLFKPQQCYVSCLKQTCKDLPIPALNLIHTLLSVEPSKRGTASSALASEYFATKPYACDPSSLPKYPPNKEIDAKCREEARKKRVSGKARGIETLRKASRKPNGSRRNAPIEGTQRVKINGNIVLFQSEEETRKSKEGDKDDVLYSGPMAVRSSSGFAWAKKRRDEACMMRSYSRINGLEQPSLSTTTTTKTRTRVAKMNSTELRRSQGISLVSDRSEVEKPVVVQRQWSHLDSFDDCDGDEYHSQELSVALYRKEVEFKRNNIMGEDLENTTGEFTGSLMLSQSHKNKNGIDELLERHERHICQALGRL